METETSIIIPNHLQGNCGRNLHWDYYKVDVKLKSGEIVNDLSVHATKVIVPVAGESKSKYNFQSEDIDNIRPATLISRLKTSVFGW
ncbi:MULTISPECIES: hypothetical protein [unclassified Photobacterium]|uniref:hypothetical protein n=1 Tax=unclassified Photobacterium TaxID=2628852 RepID=UPI0011B25D6F|nr:MULTISPECIES: hypothetical protein [unclassified Photobacterium]